MKILEDEPFEDFLTKWYKQPIFSSLQKNNKLLTTLIEKRKHQNKEGLILAMKEFALSKQNLFTGLECQSCFLYGEMDQAYKELYLKQNWNVTVEKISQSGHAVHIENPYECASKIKQWLTQGIF